MPYEDDQQRKAYHRAYYDAHKSNKSGVYRITCLANRKVYIGSAVNPENRWNAHQKALVAGTHDNSMLQNAWNKYGAAAFEWEVIERVDVEQLIARENHHMELSRATDRQHGFNMMPAAKSMLGYKHSEATRDKASACRIGKKQSPELIEKRIAPLRGRKRPPEVCEKISKALTGVARPASAEARANQKAAMKGMRPKNLESLWSPEVVAKRMLKVRGQKRTPEQIERIKAGILAAKVKRQAT